MDKSVGWDPDIPMFSFCLCHPLAEYDLQQVTSPLKASVLRAEMRWSGIAPFVVSHMK